MRTLLFLTFFNLVSIQLMATTAQANAHNSDATESDKSQWVSIENQGYPLAGKLLSADKNHKNLNTAVLILAGSGPTDHNGNNEPAGMVNNSYKMVAETLNAEGYSVLRVDKRGIAKSADESFDMATTTFQIYVDDAIKWIDYLRKTHEKVVVIGHSLGGLVGIQAAQQTELDKLITLASVADSTFTTLQRQLSEQPEFVSKAAAPLMESLKMGKFIPLEDVPPFLHALFHPKLQHYLQSFMFIEPRDELKKTNIPTLAIIGDTDIQVTVEETKRLTADLNHVQTVVIAGMNHILKPAPKEKFANLATYSNPELSLHEELMPHILTFIEK